MFTIRDAIWLTVIGAMAICWYADRSISKNSVRSLRTGLESKEFDLRKAELRRLQP